MMTMRRTYVLFLAFILVVTSGTVFAARDVSSAGPAGNAAISVLYDDTHGQTAGNADWIMTGAYSDVADMLKAHGFALDSLKAVSANGRLTPELLSKYRGIILAEPNNPYTPEEQTAIVAWVQNGGGAFLIADHGGADRDGDGWDAVKAFNTFCPHFGFEFKGDFFYEAPLSGASNRDHPVMFGIRAIGAWAASTITILQSTEAKAVSLIDSRRNKGPFVVASEAGKGRVVAIGDSSPFDDGTGSGGMLHDSYDSFAYSHPQLAYNAMTWVVGGTPTIRIPSRVVRMAAEAKAEDKSVNVLIDAAHGNAASDKMKTFERHMDKLGIKLFYNMNLITPETLARFTVVMLPDPSMPLLDNEMTAISDWMLAGGRLFLSGDWDSADLQGREVVNALLAKCGSVMRLNDDQVWDQTNKTNKPWGVLAHELKAGHPVTAGVKTVITWGTCSLITRDKGLIDEKSGVDVLVQGDDDTLNKSGDKNNPNKSVLYKQGALPRIPIIATEKLANGILVVSGCSNFTDYQYPDSDINMAKPGPAPFTHETPLFYDNLVTWLLGKTAGGVPALTAH
ncbi:MAG: hypothetical protein HQM09_05595 [Candidatus Riflebacteria bacterium]|nr:hypothetical protein [Candidatus Riflebacteria bacterium]